MTETHLDSTSYLRCLKSQTDPSIRMFCFPHAGGRTSDLEALNRLPNSFEVWGLEISNKDAIGLKFSNLIDSIVADISTHIDKPYILMGLSTGVFTTVVLFNELQARGLPLPIRLVAVSCPRILAGSDLVCFDRSDFSSQYLSTISSKISAEVLQQRQIEKELAIAFSASEIPCIDNVNCPISILCGSSDILFGNNSKKHDWHNSCSHVDVLEYPGEHFFYLNEGFNMIFEDLFKILQSSVEQQTLSNLKLLNEWNSKKMSYPENKCLHQLFIEAAKRTPDSIAVVYENDKLTFKELDELSDNLSSFLQLQGVKPDKVVGLYMEHCIEFVIGYIAALKAGGAYMPIEIVYPTELLERVLVESEPVIVLTKSRYSVRLPSWQKCLDMDDAWSKKLEQCELLESKIEVEKPTMESLAYVVMSSGTTGVPKGICCPHRGAVHSYTWRLEQYPFLPDDRVACHVFFVWELLRPLIGNTPLYVIPDNLIYDPVPLIEYLSSNSITRVLFTPSLLQLILDTVPTKVIQHKLNNLRLLWLCGEVVTIELRNRFVNTLPSCKLLNLYSVSECHDVTAVDLNDIDTRLSPKYASCGPVMPNVRAYILDERLEQVPIGTPGELFIGGPCLARGYLNQPQQTAQRFIYHRFHGEESSQRLYKTGDRARFLPNGHLELLGRCDFMVKIRGYSVVLGAIEAAIAEHPKVSTSVVMAEGEEGEDKKLVAYLVPEVWEDVPSSESVRKFLDGKIPHYAIPSLFILLDALPIHSASGKLDRKKLPSIEVARKLRHDSMDITVQQENLPQTKLQKQLANIWARVLDLDVEHIALNSSFFQVGGHSLLATRLASMIRDELNVKILLSDILRYPELLSMAQCIESIISGKETVDAHKKVDLSLEAVLDTSIYPAPTRKAGYSRYRIEMVSRPPRNVLVTGVTGFLGAHLVASILSNSDAVVYCLIRANNEEHARERIESNLEFYGLQDKIETVEGMDRIVPVVGDLSKPLFGLHQQDFKLLATAVDSIIHNGSEVNLVKPYEALKPVNVLGTQEVLRLAVTNGISNTRVKPVHYISTNGVFPSSMKLQEEVNVPDLWNELNDGYSKSKWVAEQLCLEASKRGLPVSILRPGNLSPSAKTGIWNSSDFVHLMLRGCLAINSVPSNIKWKLDMTPVNFAADAITYLTVVSPRHCLGQILHIQNHNKPMNANLFFDMMLNCPELNSMKKISFDEWMKELSSMVDKLKCEGLQKLIAGMDSFTYYLSLDSTFDSTKASQLLHAENIECPNINEDLVRVYTSSLM